MAGQMKSNPYAGMGKVYQFSLQQIICAKSWLLSTILIAASMVIGIPLILWGISAARDSKNDAKKAQIKTVLVADETDGTADYAALQNAGYADVAYRNIESMEAASSAIQDADSTVVMRVTKPDNMFSLTVYLPENTELSRSAASDFGNFAAKHFDVILMQKAELTAEETVLLSMPVKTDTVLLKSDATAEDSGETMIRELIRLLIPFMMMMTIYMMVVIYGQSMANSVMLEKTSKLMETILTAVQPPALMAGKLLATATAAVAQLMIWGIALFGGMIGGAFFALRMVPETDDAAVSAITELSGETMDFSIGGLLLSFVIFALGFLLYLALSGISGALASKTEDLSKTNIVFMLFLLGSFLLCFSRPGEVETTHQMISTAKWLAFFPFSSMLVTPGRLILQERPLWVGCISIVILIVTVILATYIAGKIYKMLVLYRGAPPKPKALIEMLRSSKNSGEGKNPDSGAA